MAEIRLQKYLAEAGVASRRKSEELILQGRVEVNGAKVTELGTKVEADDSVKVDGKEVRRAEKQVYIMLNKPAGFVTTSKDQFSRKTVLDLIEGVEERIYPVGRLDYETSGLLLLTNDGDLAFKLTHPGHQIEKVYHARISGFLEDKEIKSLEKGIKVEDYVTAPAKLKLVEKLADSSTVEIAIHEGRNRQVRKMFEALGRRVLKLRRVATGPLKLEGLEEGKWRFLTDKEVKALKAIR
jgi:23S rRNA pseudouridine2605 synthase